MRRRRPVFFSGGSRRWAKSGPVSARRPGFQPCRAAALLLSVCLAAPGVAGASARHPDLVSEANSYQWTHAGESQVLPLARFTGRDYVDVEHLAQFSDSQLRWQTVSKTVCLDGRRGSLCFDWGENRVRAESGAARKVELRYQDDHLFVPMSYVLSDDFETYSRSELAWDRQSRELKQSDPVNLKITQVVHEEGRYHIVIAVPPGQDHYLIQRDNSRIWLRFVHALSEGSQILQGDTVVHQIEIVQRRHSADMIFDLGEDAVSNEVFLDESHSHVTINIQVSHRVPPPVADAAPRVGAAKTADAKTDTPSSVGASPALALAVPAVPIPAAKPVADASANPPPSKTPPLKSAVPAVKRTSASAIAAAANPSVDSRPAPAPEKAVSKTAAPLAPKPSPRGPVADQKAAVRVEVPLFKTPAKPVATVPVAIAAAKPTVDRSDDRAARAPERKVRTIVVDAGHGGMDSGAIGTRGTMEKDINLEVALALAKQLSKEDNVKVIVTRKTDVFLPLSERTSIANRANADLFISVHCNSSLSPRNTGFEAYVLSPEATDKAAESVARVENSVVALEKDKSASTSKLGQLLASMAISSFINESSKCAGYVCRNMRSKANADTTSVKEADFYVLRGAQMPALLVELEYLSNPISELKLRSSRYRSQVVKALAGGILAYDKQMRQEKNAVAAQYREALQRTDQ